MMTVKIYYRELLPVTLLCVLAGVCVLAPALPSDAQTQAQAQPIAQTTVAALHEPTASEPARDGVEVSDSHARRTLSHARSGYIAGGR